MTLQASGQISLDNLQTEFGGPSPVSLFNYYRGGSYVPNTSTNGNIPTSGAISLESFYNASVSVSVSINGGGSANDTSGSHTFSLSVSSSASPTAYSWSTTAGSLSSTTASNPTLTLTEGTGGSTISATVSCTISVGAHNYSASTSCSYTLDVSETVSISGGGSSTGSSTSFTFDLVANASPTTPSSYTWSTTAGALSPSGSTATLNFNTTGTESATVTCVMDVGGTNFTATTGCSYTYNGCFSGCTRILTPAGYMRFDELPDEFEVINHTGVHRAKLLVHENHLEPMRKMGEHLVTEAHPIKVGNRWVPASDVFHELAPAIPRTVYNMHVESINPEDHHYLLENGITAHNKTVGGCFSGCTRILTPAGYMRFDELPDEFEVINHTGVHRAKLVIHDGNVEELRKMDNHFVTKGHPIKVGEDWVSAETNPKRRRLMSNRLCRT